MHSALDLRLSAAKSLDFCGRDFPVQANRASKPPRRKPVKVSARKPMHAKRIADYETVVRLDVTTPPREQGGYLEQPPLQLGSGFPRLLAPPVQSGPVASEGESNSSASRRVWVPNSSPAGFRYQPGTLDERRWPDCTKIHQVSHEHLDLLI